MNYVLWGGLRTISYCNAYLYPIQSLYYLPCSVVIWTQGLLTAFQCSLVCIFYMKRRTLFSFCNA